MTPETGLPTNVDAERFVLGMVLLDDTFYVTVAGSLQPDDFALDKHQRILRRMGELYARGEKIDRVTLANELMKTGELEACDGLGYLVSMDDGLPHIANIDSYIRIVRNKSILRKICFASQSLIGSACDSSAEPAELLARASGEFLKLAERGAESSLVTPATMIEEAGGIGPYLDRTSKPTGISTGYPTLDVMTGGLKRGCLYVVAARPKMGKTALAMNIVERVSVPIGKPGEISVIFSMEMSKQELLDRMICSRARINTQRLAGGYLNQEENRRAWKAISEIAAADTVYIDDKANTTTQDMHSIIRKQQARGKVGLVVADYLQIMLNCKPSERVAVMSQISRDMKLIAKDCKVPLLALSQLSRACESRGSETNIDGYRPLPSDLRESGSIEADLDVLASLFRGEVYVKDKNNIPEKWRGVADLEILLQRSGPTGIVPLVWQAGCVRFEERAVEDGHQN